MCAEDALVSFIYDGDPTIGFVGGRFFGGVEDRGGLFIRSSECTFIVMSPPTAAVVGGGERVKSPTADEEITSGDIEPLRRSEFALEEYEFTSVLLLSLSLVCLDFNTGAGAFTFGGGFVGTGNFDGAFIGTGNAFK